MAKTLIIANFQGKGGSEIENFEKNVGAEFLDRDDVIYIKNPKNIEELKKMVEPYQGQFDKVFISAHGMKKEFGATVHLTKDDLYVPIYEIVGLLNEQNKDTIKEFHIEACHAAFGAIRYRESANEELNVTPKEWFQWFRSYGNKVSDSLSLGQTIFLHSDEEVAAFTDFNQGRLQNVVKEDGTTKLTDLMRRSPEAMYVLTKQYMEPQTVCYDDVVLGNSDGSVVKESVEPGCITVEPNTEVMVDHFVFDPAFYISRNNVTSEGFNGFLEKSLKRASEFEVKNNLRPAVDQSCTADSIEFKQKDYLSSRFFRDLLKLTEDSVPIDKVRAYLGRWQEAIDSNIVDINHEPYMGRSILQSVCTNKSNPNSIEVIEFLLKNGAKLDKTSDAGWTTLASCAQNNYYQVIEALPKNS